MTLYSWEFLRYADSSCPSSSTLRAYLQSRPILQSNFRQTYPFSHLGECLGSSYPCDCPRGQWFAHCRAHNRSKWWCIHCWAYELSCWTTRRKIFALVHCCPPSLCMSFLNQSVRRRICSYYSPREYELLVFCRLQWRYPPAGQLGGICDQRQMYAYPVLFRYDYRLPINRHFPALFSPPPVSNPRTRLPYCYNCILILKISNIFYAKNTQI